MKKFVAVAFAVLSALSAAGAQFTLTWSDNSTNEAGFRIERSSGPKIGSSVTLTQQANVRSEPRIDASTLIGTQPSGATGTVRNVTSAADSAGTLITWLDVQFSTGVSGWVGANNFASNPTFTEIATVGANIETYVDAGLPNNAEYSYRLRAYNSAGNSGYSNTATGVTPSPANTAPTISDIPNGTFTVGVASSAIAFTVADAETAVASLTVTATSSNSTVLPTANVVVGGAGASRTLVITPIAAGTSTVTVTVSDGVLSASDTFVVTAQVVAPGSPAGLSLVGAP